MIAVAETGRAAILESLRAAYPAQDPVEFRTVERWADGGEDPLDAFFVYQVEETGTAHWRYISLGFSDLDDKDGDDLILSGFGFELSFNVPRGPEPTPPIWPMHLMQLLARYVFTSGHAFEPGDQFQLDAPIQIGERSVQHLSFADDPNLESKQSRFGYVRFLEMHAR